MKNTNYNTYVLTTETLVNDVDQSKHDEHHLTYSITKNFQCSEITRKNLSWGDCKKSLIEKGCKVSENNFRYSSVMVVWIIGCRKYAKISPSPILRKEKCLRSPIFCRNLLYNLSWWLKSGGLLTFTAEFLNQMEYISGFILN